MPDLAQLTDSYVAPDDTFPVEQLYAPSVKEDAITIRPVIDAQIPERDEPRPEPMGLLDNFGMAGVEDKSGKSESKLIKKLFGLGGEERYQLWPEKVVRDALGAAGDVAQTDPTLNLGLRREDFTDIPAPSMPTKDSTWLGEKLGIAPVAAQPNDYMVDAAQSMAALAGSGGLAGVAEDGIRAGTDLRILGKRIGQGSDEVIANPSSVALGAGPFLRPALKYDNKIYKAPLNGQHLDALPEHLQDTFHKQAMSGEDISHFNFGFMNHKGQFLSREAALDYAIKEGLVDPHAGQYGALTSTLLADSSKPGTAIEAMAKSGKKLKLQPVEHDPFVPLTPEAIEHYAKRVAGPVWEKMTPEQRTEFMSKPIKGYSMNDYHAEMQGYMPDDWYHGSLRSDRLTEKGQINPKRATSGPMPFFSNDPEMASSYAMGKKGDTSLMKHDPGDNVANYFTVSPKELGHTHGRTPYTVEQSWHYLKPEQKAEILDKYHRIGYENRDISDGPYTLHNEPYSGLSGKDHYEYTLKHEAKGNPLKALRIIWHDGGSMVGSETDLAEVYKLAGYPHNISEATAPWTEARGVMPAKLRIQSPLRTENKDELINKVIPQLEEMLKRDRSRTKEFGADMWDKEHRFTPKTWINELKNDLGKGENSYVWTSIPDKITNALKQLGYDGIIDTGGKGGGKGHTVAIPFSPEQVRSKYAKFDPESLGKDGLLLADSSKPGAAIQAIKEPFYSALEHNVNQITQSKMTGDQWLGTLANKPGVKPEELQWTGLQDFLTGNKGKPVTKEHIEQHLAANKVELKEVEKGAKDWNSLSKEQQEEAANVYADIAGHKVSIKSAKLKEWYEGNNIDATKYHSYQLPGGENYREMLLTLPEKQNSSEWKVVSHPSGDGYALKNNKGEYGLNPNGVGEAKFFNKHDALDAVDNYAEYQDKFNYKSSHWEEPNILAHVRMNDRFTPVEYTAEEKAALSARQAGQAKIDAIRQEQGAVAKQINATAKPLNEARIQGIVADLKAGKISNPEAMKLFEASPEHPELKPLQDKLQALRAKEDALAKTLPKQPEQKQLKSLHLEEIQSDWHQQGRDKGYRPDQEKRMAELIKQRDKLFEERNNLDPTNDRYKEIYKELPKIQTEINDIGSGGVGVPDAPFKKSWHELALKRMIREAAEKGYDRLSWTPGEAQAARYDLSKEVKHVYLHNPVWHGENDIRGSLVATGHNGNELVSKSVGSKSEIADLIGKEAAEKLVNDPTRMEGRNHVLQGDGLKVGGEGMKGFYDQIIPKALEKIGKEHGVKVKTHVPKKVEASPEEINKLAKTLYETYDRRGGEPSWEKLSSSRQQHYKDTAKEKSYLADNPEHTVHYIDLPQSLKDQAMHKGFPLFSGGYQFIPVQGDPFESKKK